MIQYSLEVTICWSVLYLIYICFLKKETFFGVNRMYLMFSLVIGLIIPLLRMIDWSWHEQVVLAKPLEFISAGPAMIAIAIQPVESVDLAHQWQYFDVIQIIYVVGVIFMGSRLIKGMYKIYTLYVNGAKKKMEDYTLVETNGVHLPFSFLRYVFFSQEVLLTTEVEHIMKHELTHIKSRHSYDVFFLELLHVLFWWNPLIYLYKKELRQVHEYLADAMVLEDTDKKIYGRILLGQSPSGIEIALTHQFFHSHLKQRITMMYTQQSKRSALMKYLLALPIIFGMVILFSSHKNHDTFTSSIGLTPELQEIFASVDPASLIKESETIPTDHKAEVVEERGINIKKIVKSAGLVPIVSADSELERELNEFFENDHWSSGDVGIHTRYRELARDYPASVAEIDERYHKELIHADVAFGRGIIDGLYGINTCGSIPAGLYPIAEYLRLSDHSRNDLAQTIVNQLKERTDQKATKVTSTLQTAKVIPGGNMHHYKRPIFPGCKSEQGSDTDVLDCSNKKMIAYINDKITIPEEAKRQGIQGMNVVKITITEQGKVDRVELVRNIGAGTEEATRSIFKQMNEEITWQPAMQKGAAIAMDLIIPIRFKLGDGIPYSDSYAVKHIESPSYPSLHMSQSYGPDIRYTFFTKDKDPVMIKLKDEQGRVVDTYEYTPVAKEFSGFFRVDRTKSQAYSVSVHQNGYTDKKPAPVYNK